MVIRRILTASAVALGAIVATTVPSPASAASPYGRGPNPTAASVAATAGPFAIASVSVARGNGFGGGVIYYPTATSQGTFGAVAISPGLNGTWPGIAWLGPRLASQGFVVFGIETNNLNDSPTSRGTQRLAALDFLTRSSTVRTRVDANRLAVIGHSLLARTMIPGSRSSWTTMPGTASSCAPRPTCRASRSTATAAR